MQRKITRESGWALARRYYPAGTLGTCAECEDIPASERHHWDRDPTNNAPTNVVFLCHACHQRFHPQKQTHCKRGHPLVEGNLYYHGPRRYCMTCMKERAREWDRAHRKR